MSLPLLIRQIFADLIINGPHQNFRFRSEASGVFHLKNEFEITDLIPSIMDLKIGDVKHNAFTFRYIGNTDFTKNEFGLYVVKNSVLDTTPVFVINQDTKEFTFIGKAYFTKDDGTKVLIGSGGSSSSITQADIDNILQQAKNFTQSNKQWFYKFTNTNSEVINDWSDVNNPSTVVPLIRHKLRNNQEKFVTIVYDELGNEVNIYHDFTFGFSIFVNTNGVNTWYHFKNDALDMMNKKIVQVKDPENDQDVATKKFVVSSIEDLNLPTGTIATQNWVTSQNYIVNSVLTDYVTSSSLTTTLNGYITTAAFNTYINTQTSGSSAYDSSLYSQVDTVGNKVTAYYKNINYRLRYIYNNSTLFEDYTSFRIPTEVGFGTGYSFTDSNNYEWSFRERNSSTSTPLLQFKTIAGVKSIVAPYKIQANGWTAVTNVDLITKGSVDTAINSTDPVGTIKLFIKHATAGLQLPAGYLQCNGGTITSSAYPDLFLAMGSTTLPNLVASAPSGTAYIIKALKTSS